VIAERTLLDGGQTADEVAGQLIPWLAAAHRSLNIALYDMRLPRPVGDAVADALRAAAARGVAVRIAFNADDEGPRRPIPPPPRTDPSLLETLGVPLRGVPGGPDLMHHKYVVRDLSSVWTGSTLDSWTREENVLVTVDSAPLARAYARNFEELWRRGRVEGSGGFGVPPIDVDRVSVRVAAFVDMVRARYQAIGVPAYAAS
jgi:phosphatidylserine/phosphatidylglycerophosphate/cardiolipin synthase-like enzyme